MKFKTTIHQSGNNTGIEVPAAVVEQLGGGKKPLVVVTLNGYTYRNALAVMGGKHLIALSAEHRQKAGVKGGDTVEVDLELDTAPRSVELPEAFAVVLQQNQVAQWFYESLAPSLKKKIVLLIESAKTDETRNKRVAKIVADLEANIKP
jgi:hypothetical protein